jgi:ribosomal protein S18 acetylase RimI-like enzyme
MPVVRLVQSLAPATVIPCPPTARPPATLVRPFGLGGDAERVRHLARTLRDTGDVSPRGAGLLAETASRPFRLIETWLALPIGCSSGHAPALPAGPELLGVVTLVAGHSTAGERASISWLLVHPEARRSGIGRLLVGQACQRARAQGAGEIEVECRSDWQLAIAFWEAVGFRRVATGRQPS